MDVFVGDEVVFANQVNPQCNRTETDISIRTVYFGNSWNLL